MQDCLPISVTGVPGGMAGGQRARCVEVSSGKISLSLPATGMGKRGIRGLAGHGERERYACFGGGGEHAI